jgi:hypothetical protein
MIGRFFSSTTETVRTINQKYATPHLKMTRWVRFSLGLLRGYLLLLVALMVYKFIVTVTH